MLAAIGTAAFAVRAAYLVSYSRSPWWDALVMDPGNHWELAHRVASGRGLGPYAYFRAPLYLDLLAGFIRAFGEGLWPIRLFQAALGAADAAGAFLLARRFLGRPAAALAGALQAGFWIAVYYDGELLTESLATFLSLFGLLAILAADARLGAGRRHALAYWALAGVLGGLAAIARPNSLVFSAMAPVALIARGPRSRRPIAGAAVYLAGVAACIAPVTARNVAAAKDFVLIASQGGINFWIGNHEGADGRTVVVPIPRREVPASFLDSWRDHPWLKEDVWLSSAYGAQSALHRRPRESEISDYWYGQALAWMKAHPGDAAGLLLKKALYLVQATEVSNNRDLDYHRDAFPILRALGRLNFGMISPLMVVGAALALRRWRRWLWPLLFLGTYSATVIAFFVTTRYRVPMLPEGMCLAALTVDSVIGKWRAGPAGRVKTLAPLAGLLALAAFLVNLPWPAWNDRPLRSAMRYDLGVALAGKGCDAAAERELRAALAIKPFNPEAYCWLGLIAERAGRDEEALAAYDSCLAQAPGYALPYYRKFLVYARMRAGTGQAQTARREELGARAAAALRRAHELDPAAYPDPGPPEQGR